MSILGMIDYCFSYFWKRDSLFRHFNSRWLLDDEFKEWSVALFEEFKAGIKLLMLSDLTLQELELAPQEVKEKVSEVPNKHRVPIGTTDEAIELAKKYIH